MPGMPLMTALPESKELSVLPSGLRRARYWCTEPFTTEKKPATAILPSGIAAIALIEAPDEDGSAGLKFRSSLNDDADAAAKRRVVKTTQENVLIREDFGVFMRASGKKSSIFAFYRR